ncbi:MAG: DUF2442 domain-containing protein [Bacillota bacterium]
MQMIFNEQINDYVYRASTPAWVVNKVTPCEDYTLLLTFCTGEMRLFDAKPLLTKGIFIPLKDIHLFMRAKASCGTVIWTDELDIAPEYLYEHSKPND